MTFTLFPLDPSYENNKFWPVYSSFEMPMCCESRWRCDMLQVFGHISGCHVNPAVTLSAVIFGQFSIPKFLLYTVSQCIGAILGIAAVKVSYCTLTWVRFKFFAGWSDKSFKDQVYSKALRSVNFKKSRKGNVKFPLFRDSNFYP